MSPTELMQPHLRALQPYATARHEFEGNARIFLDANENAYGSPLPVGYNRYPDPVQAGLRNRIARLNKVDPQNIFISHGSDEAIDLLTRLFCIPGQDEIILCPPTYGVYGVAASIQGIGIRQISLKVGFQLDLNLILAQKSAHSKILWLCSPNNPTGNILPKQDIEQILESFPGMVVIDEAYIHFSGEMSWNKRLAEFPRLVVLQTLSKAWGLAGLRVGMAYAAPEVVQALLKIKPPYNLGSPAQQLALDALQHTDIFESWVRDTISEREMLRQALCRLPIVEEVYASDANFLLVRFGNPGAVYRYLLEKGLVVRERYQLSGCAGCLRISLGTTVQNAELLQALAAYTL